MPAPFLPNMSNDNFDKEHANHDKSVNDSEQFEMEAQKDLLTRQSIQHLFNGYYFDKNKEFKLDQ